MLKTMEILLLRHNKKQNHILNVPIFTFKMSECIRLKFFHKNTLCILQSVLLLVLSTCTVVRERNPYYLLLAMQNVLKNQWRMIQRAGPELKQNKKQQKSKVKVPSNRPWCWIGGGGEKKESQWTRNSYGSEVCLILSGNCFFI